jgi:hypothetical protein
VSKKLEEIKHRYSSRTGRGSITISGTISEAKGSVTEFSDQFHQRQEDLDWLITRVEKLESALKNIVVSPAWQKFAGDSDALFEACEEALAEDEE